jgi:hypothetical protein
MNHDELRRVLDRPRRRIAKAQRVSGAPGKKTALARIAGVSLGMREVLRSVRVEMLPQHVLSPPAPGSPSALVAFMREA